MQYPEAVKLNKRRRDAGEISVNVFEARNEMIVDVVCSGVASVLKAVMYEDAVNGMWDKL